MSENEIDRKYREQLDNDLEKMRKETDKMRKKQEKKINKKLKNDGKKKNIAKGIRKFFGAILVPAFCLEIGCMIPSIVLSNKYQPKMDNLIKTVQFEEAKKQYELDTKMAVYEDFKSGAIDEDTFLYQTEHFVPLELDAYMSSDVVSKTDYADYKMYQEKLDTADKLGKAAFAGAMTSGAALAGYFATNIVEDVVKSKADKKSKVEEITK